MKNGKHVEDGVIMNFKNDLLHSVDDQPAMVNSQYKAWFQNGKLHRESDKPAMISDKYKAWYSNGVRHRDNAPAIINGIDLKYFYLGYYADTKDIFFNEMWRCEIEGLVSGIKDAPTDDIWKHLYDDKED
jgi:hypothetical protein